MTRKLPKRTSHGSHKKPPTASRVFRSSVALIGILAALATLATFVKWLLPNSDLIVSPTELRYNPIDADEFRTTLTLENPLAKEQHDLAVEFRVSPALESTFDLMVFPETIDRVTTKDGTQIADRSRHTRRTIGGVSLLSLCIDSIGANETMRYVVAARNRGEGPERRISIRQVATDELECPCVDFRVAPPKRQPADQTPEQWRSLATSLKHWDLGTSPDGTMAFLLMGSDWYEQTSVGVELLPPVNKNGFWLRLYRETDDALYCEIRTPFYPGGVMKVPNIKSRMRQEEQRDRVVVFVYYTETGAGLRINLTEVASLGTLHQ